MYMCIGYWCKGIAGMCFTCCLHKSGIQVMSQRPSEPKLKANLPDSCCHSLWFSHCHLPEIAFPGKDNGIPCSRQGKGGPTSAGRLDEFADCDSALLRCHPLPAVVSEHVIELRKQRRPIGDQMKNITRAGRRTVLKCLLALLIGWNHHTRRARQCARQVLLWPTNHRPGRCPGRHPSSRFPRSSVCGHGHALWEWFQWWQMIDSGPGSAPARPVAEAPLNRADNSLSGAAAHCREQL